MLFDLYINRKKKNWNRNCRRSSPIVDVAKLYRSWHARGAFVKWVNVLRTNEYIICYLFARFSCALQRKHIDWHPQLHDCRRGSNLIENNHDTETDSPNFTFDAIQRFRSAYTLYDGTGGCRYNWPKQRTTCKRWIYVHHSIAWTKSIRLQFHTKIVTISPVHNWRNTKCKMVYRCWQSYSHLCMLSFQCDTVCNNCWFYKINNAAWHRQLFAALWQYESRTTMQALQTTQCTRIDHGLANTDDADNNNNNNNQMRAIQNMIHEIYGNWKYKCEMTHNRKCIRWWRRRIESIKKIHENRKSIRWMVNKNENKLFTA